MVADGLSRWAYPVSQAGPDVGWPEIQRVLEEMENILAEEKAEEWVKEDGLLGVLLDTVSAVEVVHSAENYLSPWDMTFRRMPNGEVPSKFHRISGRRTIR